MHHETGQPIYYFFNRLLMGVVLEKNRILKKPMHYGNQGIKIQYYTWRKLHPKLVKGILGGDAKKQKKIDIYYTKIDSFHLRQMESLYNSLYVN